MNKIHTTINKLNNQIKVDSEIKKKVPLGDVGEELVGTEVLDVDIL